MDFIALILALLLPTAKVEGVVSFLGKLAERLAAEEAKQNARAKGLRQQAAELLEAANAAEAHGARIAHVGGKLTDLVA